MPNIYECKICGKLIQGLGLNPHMSRGHDLNIWSPLPDYNKESDNKNANYVMEDDLELKHKGEIITIEKGAILAEWKFRCHDGFSGYIFIDGNRKTHSEWVFDAILKHRKAYGRY